MATPGRAEQMRVHTNTMLVIGARDLEANTLNVRVHGKANLGANRRAEVIAHIPSSEKRESRP